MHEVSPAAIDRLLSSAKTGSRKKRLAPRSDAAIKALIKIRAQRLGHQELVKPLNELMSKWSLWKNLFCTTMEQLSSTREGSKQKRKHVKAVQTPAQRLLATDQISENQRRWIEVRLESSNPFAIKSRIEALLSKVWQQRKSLLLAEERERQFDPEEAALALGAVSALSPEPAPKQTNKSQNPPANPNRFVSRL